ncbi:MAG: LamG-like jellyroll fold domain-containing protein, partial [Pseudomonadota bacterium]
LTQWDQQVTALNNGNFLVAWTSNGAEAEFGNGIIARIYDASGVAQTGEIKVNDRNYWAGANASIATLANGDIAFVYQGSDGNGNGLYGRILNPDGTFQTGEFAVNTITNDAQETPTVVAHATGGFTVSWRDNFDGDYDIAAQRFDDLGNTVGAQYEVNVENTTPNSNPHATQIANGDIVQVYNDTATGSIIVQQTNLSGIRGASASIGYMDSTFINPTSAFFDDGRYITIYTTFDNTSRTWDVRGQVHNADGTLSGSAFTVHENTGQNQFSYEAKTLANGNVVLGFRSDGTDGSGNGVYARIINADGDFVTGDILLATNTTGSQIWQAFAADSNGGFIAVWQSDHTGNLEIHGQRFGAAGDKIGSEFQVSPTSAARQQEPSVAVLDNGSFVVTWMDDGALDGAGWSIQQQLYNASGVAQGSAATVNTVGTGTQYYPSAAALDGGGYVIVYSAQNISGGDGLDIAFQRFDASGNKVGSETLANTDTAFGDVRPSVASLPDGGFFVSWRKHDTVDDTFDVYGQRFDASGNKLGAEITLADNTRDNWFVDVEASADGAIVVTWQSYEEGQGGQIQTRVFRPNSVISENIADGTTVAFLSALDEDTGDSHTFTIVNGSNNPISDPNFEIVGDELRVKTGSAIDFDTTPSYTLRIRVDDGSSTPYFENVTINVTDVNEAPTDITTNAALSGEIQVNTTIAGDQRSPVIAKLADGSTVVAWVDAGGADGDGDGVYFQRYDANGSAAGVETLVNTTTAGNQEEVEITELSGGGFVVTWESGTGDNTRETFARQYNSSGVALTGQFQVNTATTDDQISPAITSLSDGGYFIVWGSEQVSDTDDIYGQRFNASGSAVGGELLIANNNGSQLDPVVAELADGNLVVAFRTGNGDDDILAKIIDLSGSVVASDFLVNSSGTSGAPIQRFPQIAALNDGGFVVSWHAAQDASDEAVVGRVFNADGSARGAEFQINQYETSDQQNARVSALADGGFVVVWQSAGQDGSGAGIYARQYDASGNAVSAEFRVNTTVSGAQSYPDVVQRDSGALEFVFASQNLDGAGVGVAKKVFAPTLTEGAEAGQPVLALSAIDPDSGDTATFSLVDSGGSPVSDPNFEIVGNELRVKTGAFFDHETIASYDLRVRVEDSQGLTYTETITVPVADLNEAPASITAEDAASRGIKINHDGGNNDYLVANDGGAVFGGATAFTTEVTFASTDTLSASQGFPLVSYAAGQAQGNNVYIQLFGDGSLRLIVNGSTVQTPVSLPAIFNGEQQTVAVSWDNTAGDYAIYLNGDLIGSGSGLQTGHTIPAGGTLVLAQDQDSVGGGFETSTALSGTLYDVRVYDDVRAADEIAGSAGNPANSDDPNLVANWTFDSFDNEIVSDATGGTNTLARQSITPGSGFVAGSGPELTGFEGSPNLIQNGSFEGNTTGWTITGDARRFNAANRASQGDDSVIFNQTGPNDGVLSQDVTTEVGREYTLSFDWGAQSAGGAQSIRIEVVSNGRSILDTTLSDTTGATFTENGLYQNEQVSFVALGASTTIRFSDASSVTSGVDLHLDDVRLYKNAGQDLDIATEFTFDGASAVDRITSEDGGLTLNQGNGATTIVDGDSFGAGRLAASNSRLALGNSRALGAEWTLSAKVKDLTADGSFMTLIADGQDDFVVIRTSDMQLGTWDGSESTFFGSGHIVDLSQLNDGNWHSFTAVGSSNQTKLFVDGELVGTASFQSDRGVQSFGNNSDSTRRFSQLIDDVKIIDRALTDQEVANLHPTASVSEASA